MSIAPPTTLKSASIGKLLIRCLWILLILGGVSILLSLVDVLLAVLYTFLAPVDAVQALIAVLLNIAVIVMALIWLYRLHEDLARIYGSYPITPGGSLARFMIPFYNLWGIWNTLGTIANHFKAEAVTERQGKDLSTFIPWFYVAALASNLLNRLILQQTLIDASEPEPVLFLLTSIVDTLLTYVQLQIAKSVISGVRNKVLNTVASSEPPNDSFDNPF